MIIGLGNDILSTSRIENAIKTHGQRFIDRCFTQEEQALAARRAKSGLDIARYAKAFAAKEAVAKALGTGFRGGIRMIDISITRDDIGAPHVTITAKAAERLAAITPDGMQAHIFLALSDEKDCVLATVVIEARPAIG